MKYLAITTCNAEQWERYGRRMATTFKRYWPAEIPLRLYAEFFLDPKWPLVPVDHWIDLDYAAPWLAEFKATYDQPQHRGMGTGEYKFRQDAVKFAHKVAAIGAAAETADCDILIWMDADIVTHAPVTVEWLDGLFPPPATMAWLDRDNYVPECGFMMFRMPEAQALIQSIVRCYRTGAIFDLPETHDSYVIQKVAEKAEQRGEITIHSLSGAARRYRGHPFVNSRLGERLDHLKGKRKEDGRSWPIDIMMPRSEPYWQ